jgi:hypothetical protein
MHIEIGAVGGGERAAAGQLAEKNGGHAHGVDAMAVQQVSVAGVARERPEAESQDLERLGDRPHDGKMQIRIADDAERARAAVARVDHPRGDRPGADCAAIAGPARLPASARGRGSRSRGSSSSVAAERRNARRRTTTDAAPFGEPSACLRIDTRSPLGSLVRLREVLGEEDDMHLGR